MFDFKKRLTGKRIQKPIDPIPLYDTVDRAHDEGPLRPAQFSLHAALYGTDFPRLTFAACNWRIHSQI